MTVTELIEILKQYPEDTKIQTWNPYTDAPTYSVQVTYTGGNTICIEPN